MPVITQECQIPGEYYNLRGLGARNGALNAYTAHAILDTLRLVDRTDRMDAALVFDGEHFHDMVTTGLKPLTQEEMRAVRAEIFRTYERMAEATTVVITLGYTESWFDNRDRMWVNKSPAGDRKLLRHADRFSFANITPLDAVKALEDVLARIAQMTGGRAKVILTTSPVPLHGTFTDRDVVSANLYSKSTLLSAAVAVASERDNVDYFPSYEIVTMSRPDLVWEDDGIHVKSNLVKRVMDVFLNNYVRGSA